LSRSQNVVADIFEAHVGALVAEGRQSEVEQWVDELLEKIGTELTDTAAVRAGEARERLAESRGDMRKRSREENAFDGGWETGALFSLLSLFLPFLLSSSSSLCNP
jgi:hypothetical protein